MREGIVGFVGRSAHMYTGSRPTRAVLQFHPHPRHEMKVRRVPFGRRTRLRGTSRARPRSASTISILEVSSKDAIMLSFKSQKHLA